MSVLSRRRHTLLLVSAHGYTLFSVAVVPLAAAPLTRAAESQVPRAITTSPPLRSSLAAGLLPLGGLTSVIAVSRRSPLIPQRAERIVTIPRIITPPNAGFGWGSVTECSPGITPR